MQVGFGRILFKDNTIAPLLFFYFPYISTLYIFLPHIGSSCRRDFICKGTASGQPSSTAALTVPDPSRQPSANQRFGYSVPFRSLFTCLIVLSSLSILHKNHSPTRSRKASRKGKKFNYKQLRLCQIGAARRMPLRATQKK